MARCPQIYAPYPAILDLEPGVYWWCSCGLSGHSPFCDGEHTGTGLGPKKLVLSQAQRVALCQCKQTQTPPFCDGSHTKLQAEESP